MKGIVITLLVTMSFIASAQFTVTPGANFSMTGDIQLTLKNIDLAVDGSFTVDNNKVIFSGNTNSSISGNQLIQFFELEMNKTNNAMVVLQSGISIKDRILFSAGLLDLNGFDADLGTTAQLDGEQESSRVIGPNGGQVLFSSFLNAPNAANPGNLGAIISSSQNLGNVVIKRGHQSQSNIQGLGKSIFRYFDIRSENNVNLNATLQFNYFDAELNNIDENSLSLFEIQNGANFTDIGFSAKDAISNFVEKTGIDSFNRFTLSSISSPLPVHFISTNAHCDAGRVIITWETAQEQNSDHFNIERSSDGIHWIVLGSVNAAGNSNTTTTYSFKADPSQSDFYRIAEYDIDGSAHYTNTIRSSCVVDDLLTVFPNPFHDKVFINITASSQSQAIIKVYDSKGALIKTQQNSLIRGTNQLIIDLGSFAKGVYHLQVAWRNGQSNKTMTVINN